MAISIQNNALVARFGHNTGYEDASLYIRSLLNLLASVTDNERLRSEDVYYVCDLISNLLPSPDEFFQMDKKNANP